MSHLFGDLRQIGIVVLDIESAVKHWVEACSVGPWFYTDKLAVTKFSYRGARYDILKRALSSGYVVGQHGDSARGHFAIAGTKVTPEGQDEGQRSSDRVFCGRSEVSISHTGIREKDCRVSFEYDRPCLQYVCPIGDRKR